MINFLTKSLSIEIVNFVTHIKRDCGLVEFKYFTKSAFVQCRKKIKPEVFMKLSSMLIDEFYTDNAFNIKLWNGFRLLAVDGSLITLPFTKELRGIYGELKNKSSIAVQARVSVLYDVLNHHALDAILSQYKIGERALALCHLAKSRLKDLIIYDRGYPSYDLVHEHNKRDISYLIRLKLTFNKATKAFIKSGKLSKIVEIYPSKGDFSEKDYDGNTPIKLRMIRIKLSSGKIEVLMTSLLDSKKYPHKIFKDLYFKRWVVETFYDELKNKLKVELFSGYSNQSLLQDFHATIFISNVQSLIVSDLKDEMKEISKGRKYEYKVNTNLSYGFLKDRIITLFFSNSDMKDVVNELKMLFQIEPVPIRNNRAYPRNLEKHRKKYI